MALDPDTRRAAQRLIEQFGDDALARAEERIAALGQMLDIKGVATWQRIAEAIRDL